MVLLDEAELRGVADRLPGWTQDARSLVRTHHFPDFSSAWGFMARVALLAEVHRHHPDWSNSYGRVTIRLTTHDAGGLTERDLALAEAIDRVALAS